MVKVNLNELKAAIDFIEKNSNDINISLKLDLREVQLTAGDRAGNLLKVVIFDEDTAVIPKVHQVSPLPIKK